MNKVEENDRLARNYLNEYVNPIIHRLMKDLLSKRPTNVHDFIIEWVQKDKHSENKGTYPPTLANSTLTQHLGLSTVTMNSSTMSPLKNISTLSKSAYQKPPVESEEENDEEMDEVEELSRQQIIAAKKNHRISVSAEAYGKYNQKKDLKARMIPKTEEQKTRIQQKLSQAFMFASLDAKDKAIVIDAMEVKNVKAGEWVIKQGEDGNELYVVDSGQLECYKQFNKTEEPKLLKTYLPGESFGELALLYNAPRAASIKAIKDSVLFALDRDTFNNIVKDSAIKRRERYETILSKIEILKAMDPYERAKIADVAVPVQFQKGQYVITQGEAGDHFYFIEEGNAVATKAFRQGEEPQEVMKYRAGDYFGELALLKNEARQASVIATTDLKLLALDRLSFQRVLGPLEEIMMRNSDKYKRLM